MISPPPSNIHYHALEDYGRGKARQKDSYKIGTLKIKSTIKSSYCPLYMSTFRAMSDTSTKSRGIVAKIYRTVHGPYNLNIFSKPSVT